LTKVLFLIPNLEYGAVGKQVYLIASALPRDRVEAAVAALGNEGPWGERLRALGVEVHVLGRTRLVDLTLRPRLGRLLQRFRPTIIHAWRRAGFWAAALAGESRRCVISQPIPPGPSQNRLSFLDRRLLRRASRIVAGGTSESGRLQALGVPPDRIDVIGPAVEQVPDQAPASETVNTDLPVPRNARVVLGVGPLDPHKGFRDALWAFDILKYLYDDLHLVLLGDGPERGALKRFAGAIGVNDRAHFVESQPDVTAWMNRAEVVWIPSLHEGGINVCLEAMAAGRPVVATRLPALAEIVADAQTGFLVPPGDKVSLARQTRLLLQDESLRQRFGAGGQRRAGDHFAPAKLAARLARLYESAAV
jgi:glycosyltransferase involved in cell wall biosynthesis